MDVSVSAAFINYFISIVKLFNTESRTHLNNIIMSLCVNYHKDHGVRYSRVSCVVCGEQNASATVLFWIKLPSLSVLFWVWVILWCDWNSQWDTNHFNSKRIVLFLIRNSLKWFNPKKPFLQLTWKLLNKAGDWHISLSKCSGESNIFVSNSKI